MTWVAPGCSRCWASFVAAASVSAAIAVHGARAEMAGDDYRSAAPAPTDDERHRIEAQIERERRAAADRVAGEEVRLSADADAEAQARRRRGRPPGERLLEAHCTGCHTLGVLDGTSRGLPGWRWTVERMRWWHGAPLRDGEAGVIAAHLAVVRSAGSGRAAVEWGGVAALAATAIGALTAAARRWLRRRPRR
jgi:hypothetical protein